MHWVWPELVWFALGCAAMWGFLRILPGRLYRGEFNDLSPVTFYTVPSAVDSPEALSSEAHDDEGATELSADEPAQVQFTPGQAGYIEAVRRATDERRAALIEAIRAREAKGE